MSDLKPCHFVDFLLCAKAQVMLLFDSLAFGLYVKRLFNVHPFSPNQTRVVAGFLACG